MTPPSSLIQEFESAWKNYCSVIDSRKDERLSWSEADIVHGLLVELSKMKWRKNEAGDETKQQGLEYHVDVRVTSSLFRDRLSQSLSDFNSKYKHAALDLVGHRAENVNDPFELCAEAKRWFGGGFWPTFFDGITDDLTRLRYAQKIGVCKEIMMIVVYDPDPDYNSTNRIQAETQRIKQKLSNEAKGIPLLVYPRDIQP